MVKGTGSSTQCSYRQKYRTVPQRCWKVKSVQTFQTQEKLRKQTSNVASLIGSFRPPLTSTSTPFPNLLFSSLIPSFPNIVCPPSLHLPLSLRPQIANIPFALVTCIIQFPFSSGLYLNSSVLLYSIYKLLITHFVNQFYSVHFPPVSYTHLLSLPVR